MLREIKLDFGVGQLNRSGWKVFWLLREIKLDFGVGQLDKSGWKVYNIIKAQIAQVCHLQFPRKQVPANRVRSYDKRHNIL